MSSYIATRQSLHKVAEHVMAKVSYAAIGHIGLRAHTGGFATQEFDGRRMVCRDGTLDGVAIDGKTLRQLGASDAELPYAATTPLDDEPLVVDARSAQGLGDWYGLVAVALQSVAPPDASPQQIWPEHFDLATTFNETNFGGSPGDDTYPAPYLYVGPWDRSDTSTFDDPWGWTLHSRDVSSVEDAIEFLRKHV
ncbi:MAG TPA: hypothetical protein VHC63_17345 [Acidimicrobiales bacterium]|nr:hypothetical protein [Acidimicrobiales bacterium]